MVMGALTGRSRWRVGRASWSWPLWTCHVQRATNHPLPLIIVMTNYSSTMLHAKRHAGGRNILTQNDRPEDTKFIIMKYCASSGILFFVIRAGKVKLKMLFFLFVSAGEHPREGSGRPWMCHEENGPTHGDPHVISTTRFSGLPHALLPSTPHLPAPS